MRTRELLIESENYLKNGDYDSAAQKLSHAVIVEPESIDLKKLLLQVYVEQEDTEKALDLVEDLLKGDSEDIELLYIKANCLNDLEK
ncbi:tetratricopeptide repeat protein, partial [Prolixibacteraceae bacterium JC049]|nr:tetratricopeptide repeat protein [Prolixibacteraceae bacterium JC049]